MADHMSRIPNGEPPIGVDDDLADATLFLVDSIPQWSEPIVEILAHGLTNVQDLGRPKASAEKNYTTTEREGLEMIYAVKKFRHYLLANKLVFFTNHQALLYLVNKPCNTGRIVRWFIILLEFDFTVVWLRRVRCIRGQIICQGSRMERQ